MAALAWPWSRFTTFSNRGTDPNPGRRWVIVISVVTEALLRKGLNFHNQRNKVGEQACDVVKLKAALKEVSSQLDASEL